MARLAVLEFGAEEARRYGELTRERSLRSAPMGDFMIIASIALGAKEKLATRNVKRFSRVPGLLLEKW